MTVTNNQNIARAIQQFLPLLEASNSLSGHQRSTLKLLSICKTSALGGHRQRCNNCVYTKIHYNSCGNRNCPCCQGVNKEKWIIDRRHDLLPVKYFHCVFTIPSELHPYFRYNKKLLYDLLLRTVKDTLLAFGIDPKHGINGKIGGIILLHTWTQQMAYHPHVHCIVPAGGLTKDGDWKDSKSKGNFLFPVRALSKLFRGKLMAGVHQFYKQGKLKLNPQLNNQYKFVKNKMYKINWVVYSKKAFGGPDQVLEYLGRYTHKICISNHRILKITATDVTFKYLDREAKRSKTKTISGLKFLKLFAEHILPKRMVKIRHFGFLSSRTKREDLAKARKSLGAPCPPAKQKMTTREFIKFTTGKDPYLCPKCKVGEMVIVNIIPTTRGSPTIMRSIAKDRKVNLG